MLCVNLPDLTAGLGVATRGWVVLRLTVSPRGVPFRPRGGVFDLRNGPYAFSVIFVMTPEAVPAAADAGGVLAARPEVARGAGAAARDGAIARPPARRVTAIPASLICPWSLPCPKVAVETDGQEKPEGAAEDAESDMVAQIERLRLITCESG